MKSWRLEMSSPLLRLQDVPDPVPPPHSVLIRVHASSLVSYMREYVRGRLAGYNPPADPFTPGTNGIGVVEAVGDNVYGLRVGQRVLNTGYVVATENVAEPAEALLSMTAAPSSLPLLNAWRDGNLADFAATHVAAQRLGESSIVQLSVTDHDPEAAGRISLLEMGTQMRILDLAEQLVRLAGLVPHKDVQIVFTGLRPGEKLLEELVAPGEKTLATSSDKIRIVERNGSEENTLAQRLRHLAQAAAQRDEQALLRALAPLVPEYQSPLALPHRNGARAARHNGNGAHHNGNGAHHNGNGTHGNGNGNGAHAARATVARLDARKIALIAATSPNDAPPDRT